MVSSVMVVVAPSGESPHFRLRCSFAGRKIVHFLPARVLNPAPAYATFSWFRACFCFFTYDQPRRSSALKPAELGRNVNRLDLAQRCAAEIGRPNKPAISFYPFRDPAAEDPLFGSACVA
jgi:hypothetical protein